MNNLDLLKQYYYDPEFGLTNQITFYKRMKTIEPKITRQQVKEFFQKQKVNQILKSIKPKDLKKQLKINAPPYSYQMDITFIYDKKVLTLIEILSRFAIMIPIKDMSMTTIIDTFKTKILPNYTIKTLFCDSQFDNNQFKSFCENNNIKLYTIVSKDEHIIKDSNRLGIVDSFTKTIKQYLEKALLSYKSEKVAFSKLQQLLKNYNNKEHSSINNKPIDVYNNNKLKYNIYVEVSEYNNDIQLNNDKIYNINQKVRILETKGRFDKGRQKFSNEIYTIKEMKGNRYLVKDDKGNILRRELTYEEIQPINEVEDLDNRPFVNIDKQKRTIQRKQTKSGVDEKNIVNTKRVVKKKKIFDI